METEIASATVPLWKLNHKNINPHVKNWPNCGCLFAYSLHGKNMFSDIYYTIIMALLKLIDWYILNFGILDHI